jgi:hypothetical protein
VLVGGLGGELREEEDEDGGGVLVLLRLGPWTERTKTTVAVRFHSAAWLGDDGGDGAQLP